ncbi:MAG: M4 family metallopeptidase [bacterium]|nr:M4 family metallopeptidase [bacterium]
MYKLVAFLTLTFCFNLYSQQANVNKQLDIKMVNKSNQIPAYIVFSNASLAPTNGENMSNWFRANLGANNEFRLMNLGTPNTIEGTVHTRYRQYYQQIPIEGSMVITHSKNGAMLSLNGAYYPNLNINTSVAITEAVALNMAMSSYANAVFGWQDKEAEQLLKAVKKDKTATYFPKAELVIIGKNYSQQEADFRLAYKFNIYTTMPLSKQYVYIDAINGELLGTEELIHTTDVKGLAKTNYHGLQMIDCDSMSEDSFVLRGYNRGNGIETLNAQRGNRLDSSINFNSISTNWVLNNADKDEVALDVHWGLEKTYDYFLEKLFRNSINDSGYKLTALVHVNKKYNNAYWDGQFVNFGDGDGTKYKPFTAIDICGHEVAHGLTQHTAGLKYRSESGALNESYSDIFGKCIEHYALPDSFTWIIGNKIQYNGDYLRSMSNPKLKNHPKYYDGQFFQNPSNPDRNNDFGGVHSNSGIQNYWFYLLVEGGTGKREDANKITYWVSGIGWDKASKIAYTTLANYLTPESDFIDAASFSILVAEELYGAGSKEANMTQMAWYAVGLADIPAVGLQKLAISTTVNLAPNPANEQIVLNFTNNVNTLKAIEICDITGQVLLKTKVTSGTAIDISGFDTGVYLVRFEDGSCLKFCKL